MTDRDLPPLDDSVRELLAFDRDPSPVDPALRARLRARIDASVAAPEPARRRSRRVRIAAAAGFAAAAAAALIVASTAGRSSPRSGRVDATARHTIGLGDRGTAIAEAGASLSWQVAADGSTEVAQARGSVLYRVDPGARFVVHTVAGDIEVAGTTFRVEVKPMNRTRAIQRTALALTVTTVVIVSVYEGIVLLRDDGGEREITAGQVATVGAPEPGAAAAGWSAAGGGADEPAGELVYEADPAGDMRLEGQVIDGDDEPVAGAIVTLDSRPPREIATEADGSFAFDRLAPRDYELRARHRDRFAGPVSAVLSATSEPVTLRLRQGSTLAVTVVDAERRPVAGATVSAGEPPQLAATTAADGVATLAGLAPGFIGVAAVASGFAPGDRTVAIAGKPGTVERTTIELSPGAPLSGVVVDPDRRPVSGVTVTAIATSRGLNTASAPEAVTDDQGRFTFPALAATSYTLVAEHPRHAPGSVGPIQHDLARPATMIEIALGAGAAIVGQVVTTPGEPAAYATLRLRVAGSRGARIRAVQADAAGQFRIGGLPRAVIELAASHAAGSAAQTVDLSGSPDREIEVVLGAGQAIAGVVVDSSGAPVGDVQLVAVPASAFDDPGASLLRGSTAALTDQGGRFEIAGLTAGAYRLDVTRPGRAREYASLFGAADATANASAGDRGVRIVLPEEGAIAGKLVFADGSPVTEFSLLQPLSPGAIPFSSTDGTFRLEELAPGERQLEVDAPGAVSRTIGPLVVEPGKTADAGTIVLGRGRAITGRVVTADGKPVTGARVSLAQFLIDTGDGSEVGDGSGAVTDGDGRFAVRAAATTRLTIAARHAQLGLSRAAAIPSGAEDRSVELVIEAPGSVEGQVRRDGQPVSAVVTARALDGEVEATHTVQTDDEGRFRFDKLAPGRWGLSAQGMDSGMLVLGGDARAQATAAVVGGQVARADIDIDGKVTLSIRVKDRAGADRAALVLLLRGKAAATNRKQLEQVAEQLGPDDVQAAPILLGETRAPPSLFENVDPGAYTVCATEIPKMGPSGSLELDGDESVPVVCTPLEVTPAPARQSATVSGP